MKKYLLTILGLLFAAIPLHAELIKAVPHTNRQIDLDTEYDSIELVTLGEKLREGPLTFIEFNTGKSKEGNGPYYYYVASNLNLHFLEQKLRNITGRPIRFDKDIQLSDPENREAFVTMTQRSTNHTYRLTPHDDNIRKLRAFNITAPNAELQDENVRTVLTELYTNENVLRNDETLLRNQLQIGSHTPIHRQTTEQVPTPSWSLLDFSTTMTQPALPFAQAISSQQSRPPEVSSSPENNSNSVPVQTYNFSHDPTWREKLEQLSMDEHRRQNVTELDLSHNNIEVLPTDLLNRFPNLRALQLRGNQVNQQNLIGFINQRHDIAIAVSAAPEPETREESSIITLPMPINNLSCNPNWYRELELLSRDDQRRQNVRAIDLSHNNLQNLPIYILNQFPNLLFLRLIGNPINQQDLIDLRNLHRGITILIDADEPEVIDRYQYFEEIL